MQTFLSFKQKMLRRIFSINRKWGWSRSCVKLIENRWNFKTNKSENLLKRWTRHLRGTRPCLVKQILFEQKSQNSTSLTVPRDWKKHSKHSNGYANDKTFIEHSLQPSSLPSLAILLLLNFHHSFQWFSLARKFFHHSSVETLFQNGTKVEYSVQLLNVYKLCCYRFQNKHNQNEFNNLLAHQAKAKRENESGKQVFCLMRTIFCRQIDDDIESIWEKFYFQLNSIISRRSENLIEIHSFFHSRIIENISINMVMRRIPWSYWTVFEKCSIYI